MAAARRGRAAATEVELAHLTQPAEARKIDWLTEARDRVAAELPTEARLSLKRGLRLPAGWLAVSLRLEGGKVAIVIPPRRYSRGERATIEALLGSSAIEELAEDQPAVFEFLVGDAEWRFPRFPGRRARLGVRLPRLPAFALTFLDFGSVEDLAATASPAALLRDADRVAARRSDAHAAREAWREAIEDELNRRERGEAEDWVGAAD